MHVNRLLEPFREFGSIDGLLYLAHRGLRRLSERSGVYVYELMLQPIHQESLLPPRKGRWTIVRELLPNTEELQNTPPPDNVLAFRFAQDAKCFGFFRKDRFIGYIWIAYASYTEDEVRCKYTFDEPGTVFDFDLYVFPDYRSGIGFPAVWDGINQYLTEQGIDWSFSRISRFNTNSLRAHERLGARKIGRCVILKLGPIQLLAASRPPYFRVSMRKLMQISLKLPDSERIVDSSEN